MKSTKKLSFSCLIVVTMILSVSCLGNYDFYKYNAVVSMVKDNDNENLLRQSVVEMDKIQGNKAVTKAVTKAVLELDKENFLDGDEIELEYVSTTEKEPLFTEEWEGKTGSPKGGFCKNNKN